MKKLLNRILISVCCVISLVVILLNVSLYKGPNLSDTSETSKDVINQLHFIEGELKERNLGSEMQSIFPEGYVFTYALYGLTSCEIAKQHSEDSDIYQHALAEARYAYQQLDSEMAKVNFDVNLNPQYGIYYRGWKNYLLANIIACQTTKNTSELTEFKVNSQEIANAFESSTIPYLQSYEYSSWPADNFLAIASLKMHDEINKPLYDTLIKTWIEKIKLNLDPTTLLIPHATLYTTSESIEGARGSSMSLMLPLLAKLDPAFALEQYQQYKKLFLFTRFGLPAVREFPSTKKGHKDLDSGPIILDVGFASSIVGVGTLKCFGDVEAANLLSHTIETFGFSNTFDNKKEFLFGQLPIADAFIAWSRMTATNDEVVKLKNEEHYSLGSKITFHLISLGILIFLIALIYRKRIWNKFIPT
jgi:hypothetical protein